MAWFAEAEALSRKASVAGSDYVGGFLRRFEDADLDIKDTDDQLFLPQFRGNLPLRGLLLLIKTA